MIGIYSHSSQGKNGELEPEHIFKTIDDILSDFHSECLADNKAPPLVNRSDIPCYIHLHKQAMPLICKIRDMASSTFMWISEYHISDALDDGDNETFGVNVIQFTEHSGRVTYQARYALDGITYDECIERTNAMLMGLKLGAIHHIEAQNGFEMGMA